MIDRCCPQAGFTVCPIVCTVFVHWLTSNVLTCHFQCNYPVCFSFQFSFLSTLPLSLLNTLPNICHTPITGVFSNACTYHTVSSLIGLLAASASVTWDWPLCLLLNPFPGTLKKALICYFLTSTIAAEVQRHSCFWSFYMFYFFSLLLIENFRIFLLSLIFWHLTVLFFGMKLSPFCGTSGGHLNWNSYGHQWWDVQLLHFFDMLFPPFSDLWSFLFFIDWTLVAALSHFSIFFLFSL